MKKKRFLTAALLLSLLWISGISVCAAEIQGKEQAGSVSSESGAIYANGEPLLIVATEPGYGKLYIDSNRDAQVSDGEVEITVLDASYTYDSDKGFYLANTSIYGGCLSSDFTGDTYVALIGPYSGFQDTSGNAASGGTVQELFGGNKSGTLIGNSQIIIAGGKVGSWIFGGSANSSLTGNTTITITDGIVGGNICSGGLNGNVNGNTSITINGGKIGDGVTGGWVYGGGYNGDVGGDTSVEITGGIVGGDVFGGCNRGGTVGKDTHVTLGGSAQINGTVLGGGGGYDNALVTVTGNTHVTLKDNAVIGMQGSGLLCGGGAECSIVNGSVFMEISGGTVYTIIPGGNLSPIGDNTGTGDAFVTMTGGNVTFLTNWGGDSSRPAVGSLTLDVSGADFSATTFNIGCDTADSSLGNVSIKIDSCDIASLQFISSIAGDLSVAFQDAMVENLYLSSPVTGNVDISFQASQAASFYLEPNVLNSSADSRLTFRECGSPTGKWGYLPSGQTTLTDVENPVLYGRNMNGNQFKTIQIKDSYLSMAGEEGTTLDTSPISYGKKLVVNSGTLRLCGLSYIFMPETEFISNPLLLNSLNSSGQGSPVCFSTVPDGTARLKWLANDGDSSRVVTCGDYITAAPSSAADTIFSSGEPSYVLKTDDNIHFIIGGDTASWTGKGWISGSLDKWCTCNVSKPVFEKYIFPIPQTQDSFSVVLHELTEEASDITANCPVVGHKGQTIAVSYELMDYTTADASIDSENRLTVSGTGCVNVAVTKSVNGRSSSDTVSFYFVGAPSSSEYENVYQSAEDILLEFDIKGIDAVSATASNSYIFNHSTSPQFVSGYKIEVQNDKLILTLPKEYMNSLEKKDYNMEAVINLKDSLYLYYSFTLSITDKRTPEGAPQLSADSLVYGNALNTITLSGDMSYKGLPVKGTFTLINPDAVPEVPADGRYSLAWSFTPENTDLYLETTGTSDMVIEPRQVTLIWNGTETRTYDGAPSNVTSSAGNLFGQDEITVIVNGGDSADAGTHTATALRLAGEKAGNYALPASASVNYIIKPAPGIASVTMEGWTYSPDNTGHKDPVPVSSTNGTENVTFLYKPKDAPDAAYEAGLPDHAGEYTVKAVFAATGNYMETTATADFTIAKAAKPDDLPNGGTILPPSSGQADSLKDLSAPEGWKWKDDTLKLVPGGSISAVLVYHDTTNYEQYEMTILISKLPEIILSATDSEYIIGEDRSSTIHCTGALQELTGVLMDGVKVDPANYTLKEGSTILTFSEKYMNQLTLGIHRVTLTYNAGNVDAVINVKEKSNNGNQNPDQDKDPGSSDDTPPDKDPTPPDDGAQDKDPTPDNDGTQSKDPTPDAGTQEEDSASSDNNAQEDDSAHTEQSTLSKKRRAPATGEPGQVVESDHDSWAFVPEMAIAILIIALMAALCIAAVLRSRKKRF